MFQIAVEQFERGPFRQIGWQSFAHGDERHGAAWRHVHAAQQFLARRLRASGQCSRRFRRGRGNISLCHFRQARLVRLKPIREESVKFAQLLGRQGGDHRQQLPRHRRPRRLSTLRKQRQGKHPGTFDRRDALRGNFRKATAALGDGRPQALQPGARVAHPQNWAPEAQGRSLLNYGRTAFLSLVAPA